MLQLKTKPKIRYMTNKQFENGRTAYHLEIKNEPDPMKANKYYSSLSAMVSDNQLDMSLSYFQKKDWGTPYDSDKFKIIKSKMKSTSNL